MAKMFKSEKAARSYFLKLDDWVEDPKCEVTLSNWENPPLQCECCLLWTGSNAYYGEDGGFVGAWCVYDSNNEQVGEAFEGICVECSEETSPEGRAVAAALDSIVSCI